MPDWKRIFDPDGLNWWTIVSGMGMNFIFTAFLFLAVIGFTGEGVPPAVPTLTMSVGTFLIPLLTAYVCGRIADERYLTYGFYPLVGYMILAVPSVFYAGVFGFLLILFGILGAFNGATFAARRAAKRRHIID